MELEVALKEAKNSLIFLKNRRRICLHQDGSNRNSLCNGRANKIKGNVLEAVGNLNRAKPNERVVKCRWVKFK